MNPSANTSGVRKASSVVSPSFRNFYRLHRSFVRGVVKKFGVPEWSLEDAVQDVFVVAHRRFADVRPDSARSLLYGIARRVASNHRRSGRRRQRRASAVADVHRVTGPDSPRWESLLAVGDFLDDLDEKDRQMFVLSQVEGHSGAEVSDAMALSRNTIYSRVRSLRRRLEHRLRSGARGLLAWVGWGGTGASASKIVVVGLSIAAIGAVSAVAWGPIGSPADPPLRVGVDRSARLPAPEVELVENATEPPSAPQVALTPAPHGEPLEDERQLRASEQEEPRPRPGATERNVASTESLAGFNDRMVRASAALRAGRVDEAWRLIRRPAPPTPRVLDDMRRVLRIEVLCARGDRTKALQSRREFLRSSPSEALVDRVEASCAGLRPTMDHGGSAHDRK